MSSVLRKVAVQTIGVSILTVSLAVTETGLVSIPRDAAEHGPGRVVLVHHCPHCPENLQSEPAPQIGMQHPASASGDAPSGPAWWIRR